jgi:hypothetical protein
MKENLDLGSRLMLQLLSSVKLVVFKYICNYLIS